MARLPDEMRTNMLLRKFSKSDHDLYLTYLLPLSPRDLTFEETMENQCQDCNSYGRKEVFCQPYTSHRRGHYQNQRRQAHDILITMQINLSRRRYETLCISGIHIVL
ncbi:unnamed protein product [Hymenolepis diminuta]|uniref:Uncharacterized protein n=1 Tax=Hymenolepis diminuta TaxID=6216 RepID=A0A564XXA4_HYMDI|nr:unnamed protein product [Hymenolepis diminuta]